MRDALVQAKKSVKLALLAIQALRESPDLADCRVYPSDDLKVLLFERVREKAPRVPGVYFVECCGFVKIGMTSNLRERLGQIANACPMPMQLLLLVPMSDSLQSLRLEKELHRRFAVHLARGREWFRDCSEIREFVEAQSQTS